MKNIFLVLSLFSSATLFAQNGAGGREGNYMQTLIFLLIAVVFFYFILWRPERKRRKALETKRNAMKKGDRVTAMGIIGTIDQIKDTSVVIKNIDNSKMEVLKMAISEVQPSGAAEEKQEEEKK